MLYSMETVVVTERMVKKMEAAELKMVRWTLGVTLKDRVRNEYIWGMAKIRRIGENLRGERLRWFRHVKRREESYISRRMMKIEKPGKRTRGGCNIQNNNNKHFEAIFATLVGISLLLPMTKPSISLHPLHHLSPNL